MEERTLVLVNPELRDEPLILDFEDEVHINCRGLIICEIPLDMAYEFLERQDDIYFEEHIKICPDVKEYLVKLRKEKEENEAIWEQVNKLEDYFKSEEEKNKRRRSI